MGNIADVDKASRFSTLFQPTLAPAELERGASGGCLRPGKPFCRRSGCWGGTWCTVSQIPWVSPQVCVGNAAKLKGFRRRYTHSTAFRSLLLIGCTDFLESMAAQTESTHLLSAFSDLRVRYGIKLSLASLLSLYVAL